MRVPGAAAIVGHVGDYAAADALLGDESAHEPALLGFRRSG